MHTSMRRGSIVLGTALALGVAAFPGAGAPSVSAQEECHYAYGGCLPYVDDLNCADIGNAVIEVWDVYDDPYRLDDALARGMAGRVMGLGRYAHFTSNVERHLTATISKSNFGQPR